MPLALFLDKGNFSTSWWPLLERKEGAEMRRIRVRLGSIGTCQGEIEDLAFSGMEARKKSLPSITESSDGDANLCSKECVAKVRIAVYDSAGSPPSTRDVASDNLRELVARTAEETRRAVEAQGGQVVASAILAVVENLVHAGFREATVGVLDRGNRVIVSDRGPGIPDPERALSPGYTTASAGMRDIIRGVGSGLGVAREAMRGVGGSLEIHPNLGGGTVVVLAAGPTTGKPLEAPAEAMEEPGTSLPEAALTPRQTQALLVMADGREVGPSEIAEHVGCSLTTAYRDLCRLEEEGLVTYTARGKRAIADSGRHAVARLLGQRGGVTHFGYRDSAADE